MSEDSILKGRTTDPAVREGITLVEYPAYLISEVLEGDGLRRVHGRIDSESLTPEAVARIITDMIMERLMEDIPDAPQAQPRGKPKSSFVPHFPNPVVSRFFGKRASPQAEPVFEDDPVPTNFKTSATASMLMRAEAVTQLWRQGKIDGDRAAHLLEVTVSNFQTQK